MKIEEVITEKMYKTYILSAINNSWSGMTLESPGTPGIAMRRLLDNKFAKISDEEYDRVSPILEKKAKKS